MNNNELEQAQLVCQWFNQLVGGVTYKALFSGYGYFCKDVMFAISLNNKVYLKAKGELSENLKKLGCQPFNSTGFNQRCELMHYYQLNEAIKNHNQLCQKLLMHAIVRIKKEKETEYLAKLNRLKELPNFSLKLERMVNKVEIDSVAKFREVGPEMTLVRLRKLRFNTPFELYLKFKGALENRHYLSYTDSERDRALDRLNGVLTKNGLQKCRTKKSAY